VARQNLKRSILTIMYPGSLGVGVGNWVSEKGQFMFVIGVIQAHKSPEDCLALLE